MFNSKIVVRTHADMIAAAAATLGYLPQESVVLFFRQGSTAGPVVRLDVPSSGTFAAFAASMHPTLSAAKMTPDGVFVYLFTEELTEPQAHRLGVQLLSPALRTATGARVEDVVLVTGQGWRSLIDPEHSGTYAQITESLDLIAWASDEQMHAAAQRRPVAPPAYLADEHTAARVADYRAAYQVLTDARGEDLWEGRHAAGESLAGLWEQLVAGARGEVVERLAAALTHPGAASFALVGITTTCGTGDFELTGLATLGAPYTTLDVDWARVRAVREGLVEVVEHTPPTDRAHVLALLGLIAWMGGQGSIAGEWMDMARDLEPVDEHGKTLAPLVSIITAAMNATAVHPAATNEDNKPQL